MENKVSHDWTNAESLVAAPLQIFLGSQWFHRPIDDNEKQLKPRIDSDPRMGQDCEDKKITASVGSLLFPHTNSGQLFPVISKAFANKIL